MTEVLQANIFFLIASIATVVFCILVAMVLFQVYKVVKLARGILERINAASEVVAEDAAHVRQLIANGGFLSGLFSLIMKGKKRTRKSTKEE